jgi:hypothetical protein
MPLAEFEPAIPACCRSQILALDRSAIGFGKRNVTSTNIKHDWKRQVPTSEDTPHVYKYKYGYI